MKESHALEIQERQEKLDSCEQKVAMPESMRASAIVYVNVARLDCGTKCGTGRKQK